MTDQLSRVTHRIAGGFRKLAYESNRLSSGWLTIICGALLLLVLLNSFLAYQSTRSQAAHAADIAHTQAVISDLDQVLLTVDNAETGQRGYIITNDPGYLAPYEQSRNEINTRLAHLRALIAADSQQMGSFATLQQLISEKFNELGRTVALQQQGDQQGALAIIDSNTGEQLTRSIRDTISAMQQRERGRLATGNAAANVSLSEITDTFIFATIADVVLLALVVWLIHRGLTQREQVAAERARLLASEQEARSTAEAAVQLRDQFLSIASHELKNPLTALLTNAQLLQRRGKREGILPERDQQMLEAITGQARRLHTLINMMLDVSRIEHGQLSIGRAAVDLAALTQRVMVESQPETEHHQIAYEGPEGGVIILGDELRLEQVLRNLLQNAIKYSPDGGQITLRVGEGDGEACVAVSDQGIGIPAEALPHLFERFYRADNAEQSRINGLGVGLYVVHEVVSQHGGKVEVQSTEGTGTSFILHLPLAVLSAPTTPTDDDVGGAVITPRTLEEKGLAS